MAKVPGEIGIVPSLLDRLLDDKPRPSDDKSEDSRERSPKARSPLEQLKESVKRDLEALLNTRQEAILDLVNGFQEAGNSLLTYGLPDLLTYNFRDPKKRDDICLILKQAIDRFEPRLKQVRVELAPREEHERALRFQVKAVLEVRPAREQMTFDAVLQLSNHEYKIKGND